VDRSGEETKRPWNIALLRPFYSWSLMYVFPFCFMCQHCMPAQD
jgi:hypothetical protein